MLRGEGNWEWVVGLVLGHGGEVDVFGIGEVWLRGTVDISEKLGYFSNTVGAIVEEEQSIVIWYGISMKGAQSFLQLPAMMGSHLELGSPFRR